MKFIKVEQNSDEWLSARKGKPTASNFHCIITPKGEPTTSKEKFGNKEKRIYKYRLVAERILGVPMPQRFEPTEAMERGSDMEPRAAAALEKTLGKTLDDGGFILDDSERFGCSPDRLIIHDFKKTGSRWSAAEVKCPLPWTHIQYMIEGAGERYKAQVQGQMLIGRFECVHFWSYHPDFAPVHVITYPDEPYIKKLENLLNLFCDEVDAAERWVRRHGNVEEVMREVVALEKQEV